MAPHPDNPRLPIWHTGVAPSTTGSAAPVADDDGDYHQQTSLGSMQGEIGSSHQSASQVSRPSPQLGQASQDDDAAMEATSIRVTRSRSAQQAGSTMSSSKGKKITGKRRADTLESASKSAKAPRNSNGKTPNVQPLRQMTITEMYSDPQDKEPNDEPPKHQPSKNNSTGYLDTKSNSKAKKSNDKPPKGKLNDKPPKDEPPEDNSTGSLGRGDGKDASGEGRPLRSLREIVLRMIGDSSQIGLEIYTGSGRQYYIRAGTLCSGTDAPIHVMNLFEMLKNSDREQVFTTINCFGCEIEPYKQSFLMRNSKPELLFKDAADFATGQATRARLITGAMADIPPVDIFIAGTACVDFSTLNTTKIKTFAGISNPLQQWKTLKGKHKTKLSRHHLSPEDWLSAIRAMCEQTQRRNTSTRTFAAAVNYAYWHQPMILIFENVDSAPWDDLIDCGFLELMGYAAKVERLDTKEFHMPQTRKRKYMIAFSHSAFTLNGAQKLCDLFHGQTLPFLKHAHTNSVTDFILPLNSLELHRARSEMELAAQTRGERETNWVFSKGRHTGFRRKNDLPDRHHWLQWEENGSTNPPSNMWKGWANRQPARVFDVLECIKSYAAHGKSKGHGQYDLRFKAQVIDCSQNVDRLAPDIVFGRTGCLTPNAIPVLTLEARPIIGTESLRLQGLPVENFDMSVETQAQLQDLAGNAMTTTVVGAVILGSLAAIARLAPSEGLPELETLFQRRSFEPKGQIPNSFHEGALHIDHGPQRLLHIRLDAYMLPRKQIRLSPSLEHEANAILQVLALGERARRRCVCNHILSYSSVELHVCVVCGTSLCKSCKGNPEHALIKSPESTEDLNSLPYAQAEHEFRKCFPSILWMRSETSTLAEKLCHALLASTYSDSQRCDLASAVIEGLCNRTYQLQFIEITEAVRLEYAADSTFILRAVVEKSHMVWYLHLDQFSCAGKKLSGVLTTGQPIARAVLGPEERNQFPDARAWEFWVPHRVSFPLTIEVQKEQGLQITEIRGLEVMSGPTQRSIEELQGSVWTFHPECGFAEDALWVHDGPQQKLFLFKDINPVGRAEEDGFVISATAREMGRTPDAESRPVLLHIHPFHQIHREFKSVIVEDGPFLIDEGHKMEIQGHINGWWEGLETHGVRVESFPNLEYEGVKALAKGAPTSIRRPGDPSKEVDYHWCDKHQCLLTTSLPLHGTAEEVEKVRETLKTLNLDHQLDLAELTRLIGPLYSAVEMGLVGTGHKVSVVQKDVKLLSDCVKCAPRIPEVFYVKLATDDGAAPRGSGTMVARHRAADQRNYQRSLQTKPPPFHIDHNVTTRFDDWRMKKDGFPYVDVRFIAHGHALLHQARNYLPQHPAQYGDSTETTGDFAMEIGVIENPRVVLRPATILAPEPGALEDARQPTGFHNGLTLFEEQIDSLQWMISRESGPISNLEFTEVEVAEVYSARKHLRVFAQAKRRIVRRGRIVADNVGFGKTAVCLGLIDVQYETDRKDFLGLREKNEHLDGLVHLHATLVIVPNQLTQQWADEAGRFLGQTQYNILMIPTFSAFKNLKMSVFKKADVIICSNKVFQDSKYHSELSRYCSTNGLDKVRTLPKVYRAWYKQFLKIFGQVRKDVVQIVEQGNTNPTQQQWASLQDKLNQIRTDQKIMDGEDNLSFAPPEPSGGTDCKLSLLPEMFSFPRVIWDEFPYENIPVTEFVANSATISKWMLSGTPPMDTLGDVCKAAYLFNVHVARPLPLIKGRQPPSCEYEPLAPHSDLESTSLFQSRHSPRVLVERHEQSLAFVHTFMRKNDRKTDVTKIDKPIVLSMSSISLMFYVELQLELRSRQFNANSIGSECRWRLMSRVAWKGRETGRDRSIEALMICASGSPEDVMKQSGLTGITDGDAAKVLLATTEETIRGTEDRGRELISKAVYLAQKLAFITISNTKSDVDGQDTRQIDYYQNLEELVQPILQVDIGLFKSWEAFESAMRMLIWDEGMREALRKFRNRPRDELRSVLQTVFDGMTFCNPLTEQPSWPEEDMLKKKDVRENFEAKKKFFKIFRDWLTKTPLHSRRWFLVDNVTSFDAAEEELLRLEWSEKVPWESNYDASSEGRVHMLVPISRLRAPSGNHKPADFNFEKLKNIDKCRRATLGNSRNVSPDDVAAITGELADYKDTKVFWEETCNRRGLVVKSTDKKDVLIARVVADRAKLATDKDYVSPESCGVTISDFPQQGKQKIRGGNMEIIFNDLMQTVDGQMSVYERSIVAHARRNLQQVVADILEKKWVCQSARCAKKHDLRAHFVSVLCGHVFCGQPDDGRPCGVNHCRRHVKSVCVPLSKIAQEERVITASSLSGAIAQDPDPYLGSEPTYMGSTKGPKARAVINLIRRINDSDAVVLFVQHAAMEKDIYSELLAAGISHVESSNLCKDEAGSLEEFKTGHHKVLVQTINSEQAAGSNLHNANHIIFVSPLVSRKQSDWDNQMKQALGRCVRFRQSKTVYVYHMLMDDTIEVDTLEWRMKKEIIAMDGQAVARFNECPTRDFLSRYEGDETANKLQLAPGEGRARSILPHGDIQSLMGDDYLSLASVKAIRTIDESMADQDAVEEEDIDDGEVTYLWQPAIEYEDEYFGDQDVRMDAA